MDPSFGPLLAAHLAKLLFRVIAVSLIVGIAVGYGISYLF